MRFPAARLAHFIKTAVGESICLNLRVFGIGAPLRCASCMLWAPANLHGQKKIAWRIGSVNLLLVHAGAGANAEHLRRIVSRMAPPILSNSAVRYQNHMFRRLGVPSRGKTCLPMSPKFPPTS